MPHVLTAVSLGLLLSLSVSLPGLSHSQQDPPPFQWAQQSTAQLYAEAQKRLQSFMQNAAPQDPLGDLEKILTAYNTVQQRDAGYNGRIKQDFAQLQLNLKQKVADIMDQIKTQARPNQALLKRAADYLSVAKTIDPGDYVVYSLLGHINGLRFKAQAALNDYTQAQKAYAQHPPQEADPLLAYSYLRQSQIASFDLNDHAKALSYVKQGEAFLKQIKGRYQSDAKKEAAELIEKKLLGRRLEVYLKLPTAKNEALAAYQATLKEHPKNDGLLASYGALQAMHGDIEGAQASYKQALFINPKSELAYFGWGQLHLNEALRLLKAGNKNAAHTELRKADPMFQELVRLNPKHREALQALIQIHTQLGHAEQLQRFKNQLKSLP